MELMQPMVEHSRGSMGGPAHPPALCLKVRTGKVGNKLKMFLNKVIENPEIKSLLQGEGLRNIYLWDEDVGVRESGSCCPNGSSQLFESRFPGLLVSVI